MDPPNQPQDTASKRSKTCFEQEITRNLVQRSGSSRVSRVKPDDVGPHDYYPTNFSAPWCPHCRTFTPKLVDFYNTHKAKYGDQFEIILLSRDKDEKLMDQYISDYIMNWPTITYSKRGLDEWNKYKGRGIPCLVLVDKDGKVVSHSYEGDNYIGPSKVVKDLRNLLASQ